MDKDLLEIPIPPDDCDELYDFDPSAEARAEESLLNEQKWSLKHFNTVTLPQIESSLKNLYRAIYALETLNEIKGGLDEKDTD